MKMLLAVAALCVACASGCASEARWDASVFPNQVVYDASGSQPVQASLPEK